jgi:N-acetylglucosaminyldiphosphoundecaprenol N-acetyl-beta-D-mannosaminyltransferase
MDVLCSKRILIKNKRIKLNTGIYFMKIDFMNIPVDALTMQETINKIDEAIQNNQKINHVVINAGKVVAMQKDSQLFKSVVTCDLISADGQSIVWAARFLGKHLPCRVAGIDLMQELVNLAYKKKYKCFFFGAQEEVVKNVADFYTNQYGSEILAGYRNGYFTKEEEPLIAQQIRDSSAQLLFVAISSPKKENFLYEYKDILSKVNFTMGVGGSFDVISGKTKRAPKWMQKIGMEWFYRFAQEPKRMWRRYIIGNFKFIWLVLKEKIKIMTV